MPQPIVAALLKLGVTQPYPIQAATLPDALAGRDLLGRGRTGSGKTFAFLIPIVARLMQSSAPRRSGRPRALILAPTRELATQINASLVPLARAVGLTSITVFGGASAAGQIKALRAGVDIVVACPGRLEDHLRSKHVTLADIEIAVLDEADHMADLGFLPAVKRLLDATPEHGQRLLFSATLDNAVDALVKRFLHNPVVHHVDSRDEAPIQMAHHVLHVGLQDRLPVLVDLASAPGRTLVFTRTRHGAKKIARHLSSAGVPAVELHGDLSQAHRSRNLAAFATGAAPTLVATDIAARGIHVDDIQLVIHADPPAEHKTYLHRSGRTARAGATGTVVTLALGQQLHEVRALTKRAGITPSISQVGPTDPILAQIAPGQRVIAAPADRADLGSTRSTQAADRGAGRGANRGTTRGSTRGSTRGATRGTSGTKSAATPVSGPANRTARRSRTHRATAGRG